MNLIRFLTIGTLMVIVLGEFGKYPFGDVGNSINLLDIFVALTGSLFLIWKIGVKKQLDFPKIYISLLFFAAIGLVALIINNNYEGLLYLVRFIFYSLFLWIGFSIAQDGKKEIIQQVILGVGLVLAVLGFLQLIFFPDLTFLTDYGYDPHKMRLASTMLDPNFLGAFLTLIYAVGVIKYMQTKNKQVLGLLLVLFVAIILTYSRSAWVFFGILHLFIMWFLPKKVATGLIILSIMAVLFIPRIQQRITGALQVDVSASERLISWEKGVELFKVNPLVGIGFNNVRSVSVESGLIRPFTPDGGNSGNGIDSSWLLILVTTGIAGFIVFVYFYFRLLWTFIRKVGRNNQTKVTYMVLLGILVGFFVQSQFINSLFYPQIMIVFYILMGMYYADTKQNS